MLTIQSTRSCPACGLTFTSGERSGRQRIWCSAACRQRGYRLRNQPPADPVVVLPKPPLKAEVVYECPECEARYLGIQRCDECNVFARRVGPGAPCPHCNEPVAVADLIPGAIVR
jgi:hypothetical protein